MNIQGNTSLKMTLFEDFVSIQQLVSICSMYWIHLSTKINIMGGKSMISQLLKKIKIFWISFILKFYPPYSCLVCDVTINLYASNVFTTKSEAASIDSSKFAIFGWLCRLSFRTSETENNQQLWKFFSVFVKLLNTCTCHDNVNMTS